MEFWPLVRAGSALVTCAGFVFGLSERAYVYWASGCQTQTFCLLMTAFIFATINALNYPWGLLRYRAGHKPDSGFYPAHNAQEGRSK